MNRYGRVDNNHGAVVEALRAHGVAVQSVARVGGGVPDLLCCHRGWTVLLEVKSPRGIVKSHQAEWHEWWRAHGGMVVVVRTVEEALRACRVEGYSSA